MANDGIRQVYCVDRVDVHLTRTSPPWIILQALGRAPTTGWTNVQLAKCTYVVAPEDGIQQYDLVGLAPPPGQVALEVLSPIAGQTDIPDVDLANFWGPAKPLTGIRVLAAANNKTVMIVGRDKSLRMRLAMTPMATEKYVAATGDTGPLHFNEDIKRLFRDDPDVTSMIAQANLNLHSYVDVKAHADKILRRLRLNMPCDGLWPDADIAKFEKWKNDGLLE